MVLPNHSESNKQPPTGGELNFNHDPEHRNDIESELNSTSTEDFKHSSQVLSSAVDDTGNFSNRSVNNAHSSRSSTDTTSNTVSKSVDDADLDVINVPTTIGGAKVANKNLNSRESSCFTPSGKLSSNKKRATDNNLLENNERNLVIDVLSEYHSSIETKNHAKVSSDIPLIFANEDRDSSSQDDHDITLYEESPKQYVERIRQDQANSPRLSIQAERISNNDPSKRLSIDSIVSSNSHSSSLFPKDNNSSISERDINLIEKDEEISITKPQWNKLPNKVFIRIFRYLKLPTDLYPLLLTSKTFYRLASHDSLWNRIYFIFREELYVEYKRVQGLEKKGRKDFRKLYIMLKKNRCAYIARSEKKKAAKQYRRCALFFSSLVSPIAFLVAMIFGLVFFGLYVDGYLFSKIFVLIPFIFGLLLYIAGIISFMLRETIFCRACFYNFNHLQQFICLSLAPLPYQITLICFLGKWGIFERVTSFKWIYAFSPAILSYWIYYCPCLGALLFTNLKGLHRRRKFIRLTKQHAMELENSVVDSGFNPPRVMDTLHDEFEARTKMRRLQHPEYYMGNEFYILYLIVFLFVIIIGIMTILIPLKLDQIITASWGYVFIPLWLLSGVFMILIPCWSMYEMFLNGDFKLFGLSAVPVVISLPFFVSLILIALKIDNVAPNVPLSVGLGVFSGWLLLLASAYGCFQSTNLMIKKNIPLQEMRALGSI